MSNQAASTVNIHEFKAKWTGVTLTERSSSRQHFLDLCGALDVPKPVDIDREGSTHTFERGVSKMDGGKGFADVWYRRNFTWVREGSRRDLGAAHRRLKLYREVLENPPLHRL
jgi:hypothetical protein